MKKLISYSLIAGATVMAAATATAGTLDDVVKRGKLKCIVSTGTLGLSSTDDSGKWVGLDVSYCRGLAAAVLGDASKVEFIPTTAKTRFTALQSGEGDVLSRGTTWTLSRDTDLGLDFVGVSWYDGQGFLINKNVGVNSAKELDGASICIQQGTTTELNLAEYFKYHNMSYTPVPVETDSDAIKTLASGGCDVVTTDLSGLAGTKAGMSDPSQWVLLPEVVSKEPLGPSVRHGDNQWGDIARWVLNTIIVAEELGITSKNIDSFKTSKNQEVLRLLGESGQLGEFLGIRKDFGYQVIKQVGNFGEIYESTLGAVDLPRGVNQQWTKGGLLYAPPFR